MSACHDQANFRARYAKNMEKVNSLTRKSGTGMCFYRRHMGLALWSLAVM
jgi:hypothetical protein